MVSLTQGGGKEVLTGFAEGSTGGFPGTDSGENQAGTLERDAVFEIEGAGVCGVMSTSKGLNAKNIPIGREGPTRKYDIGGGIGMMEWLMIDFQEV